ncbi:hypothetical protein AVEN_244010-1 [Araneus ventricosus]|uniref:Uncharacterized protein n=1 Tax=Araneus ventricosus TaxID=182803 RepID=A0A4Y2I3C7_ARAVE|nr:hypothetical protein AVEN_244010-1 [Araneus ventricosus]
MNTEIWGTDDGTLVSRGGSRPGQTEQLPMAPKSGVAPKWECEEKKNGLIYMISGYEDFSDSDSKVGLTLDNIVSTLNSRMRGKNIRHAQKERTMAISCRDGTITCCPSILASCRSTLTDERRVSKLKIKMYLRYTMSQERLVAVANPGFWSGGGG